MFYIAKAVKGDDGYVIVDELQVTELDLINKLVNNPHEKMLETYKQLGYCFDQDNVFYCDTERVRAGMEISDSLDSTKEVMNKFLNKIALKKYIKLI